MIPLVGPSYNAADRAAVAEAATPLEDGEAYVARLEARLADHFGAVGAVCTTSGTAALHLALMALDYTYWLVPSYSCVALLHAAKLTTADVLLADSHYDPESMDYNVEAAGIVPSMFGVRHSGYNVEDLAMALGATPARVFGRCAVLSFHESKIISAQHGGAVVTNDPDLLSRLRDLNGYADAVVADRLNDSPTYTQRVNYRMSGLSAALALTQMDRLSEFVARRAKIAAYYNDRLKDVPAILPTKLPEGSIYGRYVMALTDRHPVDAIKALEAHGIEAGRGVWPLLHRYLGLAPDDFPNAEKAGRTVLSLPCYPALRDSDVEVIADAARKVLG